MKKCIFIILIATAFSCGSGDNKADKSNADSLEQVEQDATNIDQKTEADTSSTWDQDRDRYDRDSVQ